MKKLITIILFFSPIFLVSCGTNASQNTDTQTDSFDAFWNNQGYNQGGVNTRTRAS